MLRRECPIRVARGDITAKDAANLVGPAALTSTALDALAQLHLPDCRRKLAA